MAVVEVHVVVVCAMCAADPYWAFLLLPSVLDPENACERDADGDDRDDDTNDNLIGFA